MATITTETWTGSNGAAWPAQWADGSTPAGASATIQSNAGRMTLGSSGSSSDRVGRRITTDAANVVMTSKFRINNVNQYPAFYVRTGMNLDTGTGYCLDIDPISGLWRVQISVIYSRSNLTNTLVGNSNNIPFTFATNTWYWVSFGAVGSAIKGKVWADGTPEPGWQWESTDSMYVMPSPYGMTTGWASGTGNYTEFDDFKSESTFPLQASASQAVAITQTASATVERKINASQNIVISQSATRLGSQIAAASQAVTITQSASAGVLQSATASQTIVLDQTAVAGFERTATASQAIVLTQTASASVFGEVGGHQARYGKNYSFDLFHIEVDARGFLVGRSRLGVDRLVPVQGDWVDVTGDFVGCSISMAARVEEGLYIRPDVSTLNLTIRDPGAFQVYDGMTIRVRYDDTPVFTGFVSESELSSEITDDGEEFTITISARGYEAIRNQLPAIGAPNGAWSSTSGGESSVVGWNIQKVRDRAVTVAGRTVVAEDGRADVQLDERMGATEDVSGTQGEILEVLAQRAGLLVDTSDGATVRFRSYQGVPVWDLLPSHVVSGYQISVDRDIPGALGVTRSDTDENNPLARGYRASSGRAVAQVEHSIPAASDWDMAAAASYAPLAGTPERYLASARVGRANDIPLVTRLPILARFTYNAQTYAGAVVNMNHSITKERWMIDLGMAPASLVTRNGDLNPLPPANVQVARSGNTATVTWDTPAGGVTPYAWEIWYAPNPETGPNNARMIGPTSAGLSSVGSVRVYTAGTATIPGLDNGSPYRFTVYAFGAHPDIRSAPSLPADLNVPPPTGLVVTKGDVTNTAVQVNWAWFGAGTPTGYKVGRNGVDSTGYGAYETIDAGDVFARLFDKLVPGTTYTFHVAAMNGTAELERLTLTVQTLSQTTDPGDPTDPEVPTDPGGRLIPLVGRSGLKFNSVYFKGGGPSYSVMNASGTDRGRAFDGCLFFPGRGSWDEMRSWGSDAGEMIRAGLLIIVTIPIAPQSEGASMNARGADNAYAAQQRSLGAWVASQGFNKPNLVFRLNWEANGNWYPWHAGNGGAATFARAYQNCVTNLRAGGATNVRFNLCWNKGPSQTGIDYAMFPGAEYCDVVGVDQYDQWMPAFNDAQWNQEINKSPGLKNLRDFAVARGIMWSLDEGGNTWRSGLPNFGQDNPFYWQKIWQFFNDPANVESCAWHNTYDHAGAPPDYKHDWPSNPNSYAYYKTTFGGF